MSPLNEVAGCLSRGAVCGHAACLWFVTRHMAFPISGGSAGAEPAAEREGEGARSKGAFQVCEPT